MAHHMQTQHTADALEARDTAVDPLLFAIDPIEQDGRYQCGDPVILTTRDGAVFIGHLSDVEEDRLRIYVELD